MKFVEIKQDDFELLIKIIEKDIKGLNWKIAHIIDPLTHKFLYFLMKTTIDKDCSDEFIKEGVFGYEDNGKFFKFEKYPINQKLLWCK